MQTIRTCILLFLFIFSTVINAQNTVQENIKNAQACFARLDKNQEFKDNLSHADMNVLPVGTKQTINNMDVTIAVSSAEFFPEYTSLNVFARIKIPEQNNKTLFFGAKDIKLSHSGDIIGDAKLVLLGDLDIPVSGGNIIFRLKGGFNTDTGQGLDLTYVTIDCKGFKGLGLTAEVELSPKLCYPVDMNGDSIPKAKVVGKFQTEIEGWSDIVAKVSFPSFAIKGLKDFIWTVEDAIFDFSDLKNAQGFSFPDGYQQYLIPGNEVLWRGVYIRNLAVTLPKQFAKGKDKRVSFSARDMLIDDNGITGKFGAHNILSINEGNASGWAFSVDYFGLELMANRLEGAEFDGLIGLPISDKSKLNYKGLITADDKYLMRVSSMDTLSFDLLQAKAELDPNSFVEFKVEKGKFRPEAMLHGRMGINMKLNQDGKEIAQFKGVEFRSLHLKTENPYLSVEYLGYKGEVKLMNFPISVKDIALRTQGNKATLGFDVDLTLSDGAFSGNTRLEIVGNMQDGELHRWKYEKTIINKINIAATIGATFSLKGGLTIMNDDPIYGDGFGGELSAEFTDKSPLKGLKVAVRGMFGRTDFRYWFVDGIATLPGAGIAIGPGINLTGFGGGITYRMQPNGIQASGGNLLSATSMTYRPNEKSSLGIKASVAFAIPNKTVAQGEACFELAFNNKGGLDYAGFYGYAKFIGGIPGLEKFDKIVKDKYAKIIEQEKNSGLSEEELKKQKQYEPNKAAEVAIEGDKKKEIGKDGFTAAVGIQFNFAESSFHATFDLYANVLGGLVRGAASGNRAGYAVIHIDPKDWYIHMGTPTDRIGLKMGIGNILNVETGSYLMVGTQIPAAPGVPPQVASILGYTPDNLNYMKNLNSLGDGKGFAFGSSLSVSTGDITFLILYANFGAGLGFDIMLKDYGDAQCKGRSGAIGIDGWYANGQAYAYLHGELGVKVKLWFIKAKIPIITADIAVLMQAKLPNPSSFKAYLAVRAKVLGIIKVNCRFKLSIGEDCELIIPGGSPLDMRMISDLSPTDKSDEISVFTAPQASFNMAIGKAFDVQDDEGDKTYRIQLKDFVLNDGQDIIGKLRWNEDKDAVSFYSHEILPPHKEVTATVNVVFEELRNGRWNRVYTAGKEAVESMTIRFNTSDAPKDIPLQNIVYAYPVVDQRYYLKDESNKGYIQLEYGQNYLFPTELKNQVVVEDESGNKYPVDFRYNQSSKRMDYAIPQVKNLSKYKLSIVSLGKEGESNMTNNATTQSLLSDKEDGDISVDQKQAQAETRTDVGAVLLTYDFATSRYSTFKQKIEDIKKTKPIATIISSDVLAFGYETQGMEPFELAELVGTDRTENKPLVDVRATLDDYYYTNKIHPLIYENYPVDGIFTVQRENIKEIGVPPAKALPIYSPYLNRVENGEMKGLVQQRFPYNYNLPDVYKQDFIDLQHQVINKMMNTGGATYSKFVRSTFPFISSEYYKIKMQYVMPGGVQGTSAIFDYYNFVK